MKIKTSLNNYFVLIFFTFFLIGGSMDLTAQKKVSQRSGHKNPLNTKKKKSATTKKVVNSTNKKIPRQRRIFYGNASFYSNSFHGKKTANGETFSQNKYTAACNVLPLGTWVKITNLSNNKSVILKTTDRLHKRMRRLVDLSRSAAKKLDYIKKGLTRVKVEVLNQNAYNK